MHYNKGGNENKESKNENGKRAKVKQEPGEHKGCCPSFVAKIQARDCSLGADGHTGGQCERASEKKLEVHEFLHKLAHCTAANKDRSMPSSRWTGTARKGAQSGRLSSCARPICRPRLLRETHLSRHGRRRLATGQVQQPRLEGRLEETTLLEDVDRC